MTTIEALQNLYEALGGEASAVENINTIPAMLSEIAGVLPEGGGLPDVTAEDNGKVLKVIDGAWNKAKENGTKIYYAPRNGGVSATLSDGKTIGDILNDINNDVNVIIRDELYFYNLSLKSDTMIKFVGFRIVGETSISEAGVKEITFNLSDITKNEGDFANRNFQLLS